MVSAGAAFPQTRWTAILACRDAPEQRRRALEELLASYWQPLYLFLRRRGLAREEAEDAVQGFAMKLLEKDVLTRLDPERGRLRGYLKSALLNHVENLRIERTAAKRGGNAPIVSFDADLAESSLTATPDGPEEAYRRAWAACLFERAFARLCAEYESGARSRPLEVVVSYFQGTASASMKELATRHAMSVPQVKSFLHRARERFRELVREEVADTVATPGEVDAELTEVLGSL